MKILWLAPWFRTLGVAWSDGLRARGHEVVVVTTSWLHFDPPAVQDGDIVFDHIWRTRPGVAELRRAQRRLHGWRPDVVVAEIMRDPRFPLLIPPRVPCVVTTHDAAAHDVANRTPLMRRTLGAWLVARADAEVCFSAHVAQSIGPRKHPVVVVPLTTEMPEAGTPDFVPPDGRHDFVVAGRLSEYKNIPVVQEAYRRHRVGPAYRGDNLVLLGRGDPGCELGPGVQWIDERFSFEELGRRLGAAKASICLYSAGSQSGVQVTASQCGTCTLVSDAGGLSEYLPPGERALPKHDPEALTAQFDLLADPEIAVSAGRRAADLYRDRFSVEATSRRWDEVLQSVVR